MLTIWTGAQADTINKTIGAVLPLLDPKPKHEFVPVGEYLVEPPEAGVCLVMGTKALKMLAENKLVPKNRTVTSLRGKPIPHKQGHYFLTYDPYAINTDAAKREEIIWDARLAHRWLTTGNLTPPLGLYGEVDDFSAVIQYVEERFEETGKPVDVAADLETVGRVPYNPAAWIISMSFTVHEGYADIHYFPSVPANLTPGSKLYNQIRWLLTTPKISLKGANLKFDLIWIALKWGLTCTNFKADTLLIGTLLDENQSNSLKNHARIYTALGGYSDAFDAKYDKSRLDLAPKDEVITYNGGDTDACLRVFNVMKPQLLRDGQLARFYTKLLHPAARAFEKVEQRGILVDVPRMHKVGAEAMAEIKRLEKELLALMPGRLKAKFADKLALSAGNGKNPFTPAILKEFFFGNLGMGLTPKMVTEKTQEPSTAHEHLMMFADDPEAKHFVGLLEELGSARKIHSTYYLGFLEHLRPDGRFHPNYMLFKGQFETDEDDKDGGTLTGRTSAKDPAMQTLPKHHKHKNAINWAKKLRSCYIAPVEYVFWECDFSQGELRITACIAGEEVMLNAYAQGLDLHAVTGAKLAGYELGEFMALKEFAEGTPERELFESKRQGAKAGNFGLLYGMGPSGFREYARIAYGVVMTMEEAENAHKAFFDLYPRLLTWHAKSIQHARQHLMVRSPLGRIRHLPLIRSNDSATRSYAERQAINSPVQGTLSDLCLWAIAEIEREMGQTEEVQVIGMTHDAAYGYVRADKAPELMYRVKTIMSTLPIKETFGWDHQIPFPVDVAVSQPGENNNWANLQKIKLAA